MADEKPPQTGTCVHCRLPVTREDDDALWKTASGGWKCPQHPRAPHSKIVPHEVR